MESKISQWQYESDSWKRLLEFIQLENVFCKNRLAEMIRHSTGETAVLEAAEAHLDWFLQQETMIALLRNDIREFDALLVRELFEDGWLEKAVRARHEKLFHEIEKLKKAYNNNKLRFDRFLQAYA